MKFYPYPKNLDGINIVFAKELSKLSFNNGNTTLTNTIEALKSVFFKGYTKEGLNKIVKNAVNKGITTIMI